MLCAKCLSCPRSGWTNQHRRSERKAACRKAPTRTSLSLICKLSRTIQHTSIRWSRVLVFSIWLLEEPSWLMRERLCQMYSRAEHYSAQESITRTETLHLREVWIGLHF